MRKITGGGGDGRISVSSGSRKGLESLVRESVVPGPESQDRVILVQISAARRTEHVRSVLSQFILISQTDHY